MDTLNLFEGFTPEEIELMKNRRNAPGTGFSGRRHSSDTKIRLSEISSSRKHTPEELLKMSKGNAGKIRSSETVIRMSEAATGRVVSKETRGLQSKAHKGKPKSWKTRLKMSEAQTGKSISEKHKKSISKTLTGRSLSWTTRQLISEALIGRVFTEEHRRRKSEAQIGRVQSFETRQLISKSRKQVWDNLSPEEQLRYLRTSFLSDESMRKAAEKLRVLPTIPEWLTGYWLEKNHPEEWAYTGDRRSMDLLRSLGYPGLNIPDFFNINGRKAVIEVLGGLGYFHFEEEEGIKVTYYRGLGFACLILFELDCYDYDRLEAKYNTFIKEVANNE